MMPIKSKISKGLQVGSYVVASDNSGAKLLKIFGVKRQKTVKGRVPGCGVGDLVQVSVKKGRPDMRKQVVLAIIVRQKKEFRRPDGTRVAFEENAAVVVKDEAGNPKGTIIKGPVAKEACERWPGVAKIASIIV